MRKIPIPRIADIATNPAPETIFEAGCGGFQVWSTPDDHPKGWEEVTMSKGAFSKPCAFVASVCWGWEVETITHLELSTNSYDLRVPRTHNRPADVTWAKAKIKWLFAQAGVTCPPIRVEK